MSVPPDQLDMQPQTPMDDIRSNLPEVDTSIDPSTFASSPDVAVADVATIDPPQDIDAATIGDYTPYSEVSGELDAGSTVEGRLTGLLSQDSDYIKRARTNADQLSNRRGMLNSSMAAGAAEGAAIDRALPIAQQDAAAMKEQEFLNQGYSNDAAKYLAEQSVQRENLGAGLEQDTRQFNANQNFEADKINQAAQQGVNTAATAEQNKNNFAVLSADLQGQLAGIDNQLATNLEQLTREYSILENLDSVNGSIYQQMVAEIGTILANEEKVSVAQAKINNLIAAAGVEMSFSNGGDGGGAGGATGLNKLTVTPEPKKVVKPRNDNQRSCFTGDTIVTMYDGTEKLISDIEIGEELLGQSGELNVVIEFDHPLLGNRALYRINGSEPFVTAEHPFMTDSGWKSISPKKTAEENPDLDVSTLLLGDNLEQIGNPLVKVTGITSVMADSDTQLYNFSLSGNHTYYANGYLVHNKQGDGPGGVGGGGGGGGGGASGPGSGGPGSGTGGGGPGGAGPGS